MHRERYKAQSIATEILRKASYLARYVHTIVASSVYLYINAMG